MTEIFMAILGGSALATLISQIFESCRERRNRKYQKADEKDESISALSEAVRCLLMDRMTYLTRAYIRDGEVALAERNILHHMHKAGKDLGMNGDLDDLIEIVDDLPVKK